VKFTELKQVSPRWENIVGMLWQVEKWH